MSMEVLVVGQGLAGTLICHFLEKAGISFRVIDQGHQCSSSLIAAGIMNPVTGRRFVKSWLYDDLLHSAIPVYRDLEKLLCETIVHRRNILRVLPDHCGLNDWQGKSSLPEYKPYVVENPSLNEFREIVDLRGHWTEVTGSYQVDLPLLITSFRERLTKKALLHEESFNHQSLIGSEKGWRYGPLLFEKVIFCEGALISKNPFITSSFLTASKGQILELEIKDFFPTRMIKRNCFLTGLGNGNFWFGSFNSWHFSDHKPSEKGKRYLYEQAKKMLRVPFRISAHRAAIRPTIVDRRPVMGEIQDHKNLYVFNGLGTKGASLGPYWADHFVQWLAGGSNLHTQVDILRFGSSD